MTNEKSVIVTVGDSALGDIHSLADRLSGHGMKVTRVLPATGVIAGSVAAAKMATIRGMSGVDSVEEELSAHPSKE